VGSRIEMAKGDVIKEKKRRGKATLFKPEYTEQVEKLCRSGSTDKDLALFFNVSVNTIDNWKKRYPDFFLALLKGKQEADANVAEALYRNAIGSEYYEEHAVKLKRKIFDDTGKVIRTEEYVQAVPLKKHSKPDTTAQIFHLKNRRPDLWRDAKKAEHEADAETPRTFTGMAALESLKREGFVLLEGEYTIVEDTAAETIADEQ
jgi:transposase